MDQPATPLRRKELSYDEQLKHRERFCERELEGKRQHFALARSELAQVRLQEAEAANNGLCNATVYPGLDQSCDVETLHETFSNVLIDWYSPYGVSFSEDVEKDGKVVPAVNIFVPYSQIKAIKQTVYR